MRPPKFQLHLTTCIILMFAVGGFVGLNLKSQPLINTYTDVNVGDRYGWPTACYWRSADPDPPPEVKTWNEINLMINLVTTLAILTTTAVFSEWLIRRRKT